MNIDEIPLKIKVSGKVSVALREPVAIKSLVF
jgi:hypothetical protein